MTQLDFVIMGTTFKLACKVGEEDVLRQAVAYLDSKMCAIRDAGKIKGNDRIAVMAALGIAAELLTSHSSGNALSGPTMTEVKQNISAMHAVLDAALAPQDKLF
jgi:cell division protein ZapA